MLLNIIFVIVGFVLLVKGADFFVDGAASVASKLGIPQIVVGLTIVAFGTSAPEAAISIGSAIKGSDGISIGNVLGSNIMNILLILGITAVIQVLPVKKSTIKVDIPVMVAVSVVLMLYGVLVKKLNIPFGIIMWAALIAYIVYLVHYSKNNSDEEEVEIKDLSAIRIILYIVLGIAAIVWGSDLTVDGATYIAEKLGVSDRIIGLTVVAFGTSLPELVTSVTAAIKKNADIAVGNIVGSNLFNIAFVLGTTSLITSLPFSAEFYRDGVLAIVAALILFFCSFRKGQLKRGAGIFMLVCYAAYFVTLLVL